MRDRLIELIQKEVPRPKADALAYHLLANGVVLLDFAVVTPENRPLITQIANMPLNDVCELIKAKQEGRIIVPPCKVGDTVYSFCDVFGAILPYVVQDFKIGFMGKDRPNYWYWEATSHATETDELLDEIDFDLDDIGKTVFLTKEEAEAELEKRCNNA